VSEHNGDIAGVYGFIQLWHHAVDVLGSEEAASHWFWAPCRALGGAWPIDHAKTEVGSFQVDAILSRIEHGVYS
jgi:putative toxin-antitoxin system antitoxin component (TIGR02293 family)